MKKKSALDMGDWNPAMDYLDALSDDIPKGDTTELNLSWTHTFFSLHKFNSAGPKICF